MSIVMNLTARAAEIAGLDKEHADHITTTTAEFAAVSINYMGGNVPEYNVENE